MTMLSHALEIAGKGWPVFPCNPAEGKTCKHPLTEHGFKDATKDLGKVEDFWRRRPNALIGMPTGHATGVFVVDLDPGIDDKTGEILTLEELRVSLERAIGEPVPETYEVETPRGGRHLYFQMPDEGAIRNHQSILPKIDIRGTGGYIISPPSRRYDGREYRVISHRGIATPPASLLKFIASNQAKEKSATPVANGHGAIATAFVDDNRRKYANAALSSEEREVRAAPKGQRNGRLNIAAVKLGHLIAAGILSESVVRSVLTAAAAGLAADEGPASVEATINSGLAKGMAEPLDLTDIGTKGFSSTSYSKKPDPARTIVFDEGSLYDPWAEYDAPAFPLDLLPDRMRSFVEAKAVETGADISAVAMSALAVASAALTHEATLYLKPGKNFPVSARLWVLLVGPPSAKKSPAQSGAVAPLLKCQHAAYAAWRTRKAQAEKDGVDFDEPEPAQLVANDTTPEKMADILSRQDRGVLCFHDELSGFIGALDRYGAGKGSAAERAFWLKAYDGGNYNIQRIGRPTVPISNLSASILGGIQPGRLRELSGLSSDGLLQRFLPVMMRKPKLDSDLFNAAAREEWEQLVHWLLEFGAFATDLSPGARQVRGAIRESLFTGAQTESEGEAFQGFVGKLDGVWGNLALLMHILWGNKAALPVSAETASMASKLVEDFVLPHGLAFYRSVVGAGQDEHKAIGAFLVGVEGDIVKVRDLSRGPRCFRGLAPDEISKKLGAFVAGGWLEPVEAGLGNTAWRINPGVADEFEKAADRHTAWVKTLQDKITGRRHAE